MMNINIKRRYSLAANPEDSIQQSDMIGILQEYCWEPGDGTATGSIVSERDRILALHTYWFSAQTRVTQLISNQLMNTLQ